MDGAVIRANAAFSTLFQSVPDAGTPLENLLQKSDRSFLAPVLEAHRAGRIECSFSAHLLGVQGRVEWKSVKSADCLHVFATPRKRAVPAAEADRFADLANAAAKVSARLAATLQALPDMLFEFDSKGRFVNFHVPETMELAVPPEEFLGRLIEDVLPPNVAETGREAMRQVAETGFSSGLRYSMRAKESDELLWFEISGSTRRDGDGGCVLLIRDISARMKQEQELDYRSHLLRTMFDLSPVGITLTEVRTNKIVAANAAFLAMSGRDVADLADLKTDDVIKESALPTRTKARTELARTGRFGPVELECLRRDGTSFVARLSGVMVTEPGTGQKFLWSLAEDVTEEKSIRERLLAAERLAVTSRQQLLAAVESLPDGFVLFDSEDKLVMANASYRRIYSDNGPIAQPGTPFADIIRYCLLQGHFPEASGRETEFFEERLTQHRTGSTNTEQRLRDGRIVRIQERCIPDGGRVGMHVVVTDLHRAREAAEEASRAKSAFLAHMGHEIRTPLAGILGMTELLLDRLKKPEHQALAQAVHLSGETLLTILNDLLDMSKIEAGKLELESTAFVPVDLIRTVATLYELRTEGKGLAFTLDVGPGADVGRVGDPHRIAQILHNLLSNALKFTDRGGLTLSVRISTSDEVVFTVRDTGIGMTAEQSARMLKPFEQADAHTTRRYGGTGLGMSIVARLVEMMGGKLAVQSRFGTGTDVTVTLPLAVQTGVTPIATDPQIAKPLPKVTGLRVLAADDNDINRRMLQGYLERLGVIVTLAEDGQQALDMWEAGKFDIVCLDISMPVLDGMAALDLIRAKARAQGVSPPPAIAITSNAMTHQIAEYLLAGFVAHIGKPFRKEELARTLARFAPEPAEAMQAG